MGKFSTIFLNVYSNFSSREIMFHDNQAQKYVLLSSGDQRDVDDQSGDSSLKKIDYLPATEEHTCFIEPNALTGRSLLTCLQTLIIFCATVLFFAALCKYIW